MSPQESIAHYRIVSKLGEGGMGAVYRATDTKLNREVAIKVLPETFANDPDRLARFSREAQVLASLNHPNIAAIYGVEERAIVMELVEGTTPVGPLPEDQALPLIEQLAAAIEYAHEHGVIHRDLKPANLKITPERRLKVLEVGLAKAMSGETPAVDPKSSPTLTMRETAAGMIVGTAAYMAPEQARGQAVDKRADIWAFGAVLYELLTGRTLFLGPTVGDTLVAVLTRDPDLAVVPQRFRHLLRVCLERDPRRRMRDIGDAHLLLEEEVGQAVPPANPRPSHLPWFAATVFALGMVALAFVHFRETPPETQVVRTLIAPPPNTAFYPSVAQAMSPPALSRDGRRMVFGVRDQDGKTRLWVRALDSVSAQPLAGTEGATSPFWSPDGKFIAFFADGSLKKINASGGPVLTLCQTNSIGWGGTWNDDGVILFSPGGGSRIFRIAASGGTPVPVTEESGKYPWFLPDGRHFIFHSDPAVYAGSLDSTKPVRVVDADSQAAYFGGYLVYIRGDVLMAQRFDLRALAVSGESVPMVENVRTAARRMGVFSLSQTGLLVYQTGQARFNLSWFDRSGKKLEDISEAREFGSVRISPDGKTVVAPVVTKGLSDVWLFDLTRGLKTRFTFLNSSSSIEEAWSPDGKSLAVYGSQNGKPTLIRKNIDTGEEQILRSGEMALPSAWTPDGKALLYNLATSNAGILQGMMVLPLADLQPAPFPIPHATYATFSPDGHWIAYQREDGNGQNVFVAPFPGQGRIFQVSPAGGAYPRWRGDGKELFYVANNQIMAAEVGGNGQSIEIGRVRPLFDGVSSHRFDVSRDGQRILLAIPAPESNSDLTLVQNWTSTLTK